MVAMIPPDDQLHRKFIRLFTEHEPSVRTFVRSLVPMRGDAAEIMQKVALVLWEKIAEFDDARDFRKWAFGIARFEVFAHLRERARDRHGFDDALVSRLAKEASEAEPRHSRQRESLETCLKKLPQVQHETVLAAYAPGIRMDELASRRGQTGNRRVARTQLARGRLPATREERHRRTPARPPRPRGVPREFEMTHHLTSHRK